MENTLTIHLTSKAFGDRRVEVASLEGREQLGELYHYDVLVMVAEDEEEALSVEGLLGEMAALEFVENGRSIRTMNCLVSHATDRLLADDQGRWLRLRLVPRAFLATLVKTQEVFLHMSLPAIVKAKLDLLGLDHEFRLAYNYPSREFVVQYAETDLHFISRMCEHVGICFHFENGDNGRIVFTDKNQFARFSEGREVVRYHHGGAHLGVYSLECDRTMIPKHYVVADYNYRTPMVDLLAASRSRRGVGGVVEYGGHFKTQQEAERLAQLRREEFECRRLQYRGKSTHADFEAGRFFRLDGHAALAAEELLITEVRHHYVGAHDNEAAPARGYHNEFVAIDSALPYRPARVTPRPRIHGVVSGIVEAQPGTDATRPWLDSEGRYRVKFLFDTADAEGKASRAVRMAQPHAGAGYGTHFPLRPGVEVLMAFIDGDVDRPIIVGAVPNAVTPTPVAATDHMHHRIRTASGIQIEFKDGV